MLETYRGVVYPNQIDHMGHMNVQWYTAKYDEATWHLLSSIGITTDYIKKNNRGMVAAEQVTKYKAEAFAGDLIVIKSKVLEIKSKSIRFIHTMYNSETEEVLSTSEFVGVHIDRTLRKACLFPDFIK